MREIIPEIVDTKEKQNNIGRIEEWVRNYRNRNNIIPTPGRKPELSCIAFGEGNNLLWSLIKTVERDGAWKELDEDEKGEVIQLVLDEIKKPKWN